MSQNKPNNLKKLEIKLNSLIQCIIDKAATDSEFSHQLEDILLSDSPSQVVPTRKTRRAKTSFNPVEYLYQHSQSELLEELDGKTDTELWQILKAQSSKSTKIPKNLERKQLIDKIITNADRMLKKGSSFLQESELVNPPPHNSDAAN